MEREWAGRGYNGVYASAARAAIVLLGCHRDEALGAERGHASIDGNRWCIGGDADVDVHGWVVFCFGLFGGREFAPLGFHLCVGLDVNAADVVGWGPSAGGFVVRAPGKCPR